MMPNPGLYCLPLNLVIIPHNIADKVQLYGSFYGLWGYLLCILSRFAIGDL